VFSFESVCDALGPRRHVRRHMLERSPQAGAWVIAYAHRIVAPRIRRSTSDSESASAF
jgi:hypothetical protein